MVFGAVTAAEEYPKHYEKVTKNGYSMIVFRDSSRATYLTRITRDDGSIYFYFDDHATWGAFGKENSKVQVKPQGLYWINTKWFRIDFIFEKGNLIEITKMGRDGIYLPVENDCKRPQPRGEEGPGIPRR